VLVTGQPLMAACIRLADGVVRGLDSGGCPQALRAATAFAETLSTERDDLAAGLAKRLPAGGIVLTVSASSSVLSALSRTQGIRVLCAISEPGAEGKAAVHALQEHDVDAVLIPDGAVAQQSTRADAIVFGADAIGPGAILNKTGTLAAALGARSSGRPCICVAGTTKLVDETVWPYLVTNAERLCVEGVQVFEEVPASVVTTFVTGTGSTTARSLRRAARSLHLHPRIAEWMRDTLPPA
jgi:translation initiation factor 2B subunit (eIF-2B alpha/beta/delta family)